jgi:hypothetical protein
VVVVIESMRRAAQLAFAHRHPIAWSNLGSSRAKSGSRRMRRNAKSPPKRLEVEVRTLEFGKHPNAITHTTRTIFKDIL